LEKSESPEAQGALTKAAHAAAEALWESDKKLAAEWEYRALHAGERAFGTNNISLASILANLAKYEGDSKQFAAAEILYERQLKMLEEKFGPSDSRVAKVLEEYSAAAKEAKDNSKADALAKRAAAIRSRK